jgi:hypothetical protein
MLTRKLVEVLKCRLCFFGVLNGKAVKWEITVFKMEDALHIHKHDKDFFLDDDFSFLYSFVCFITSFLKNVFLLSFQDWFRDHSLSYTVIRRSSICYTSLKFSPCVPDPWIFCTDPDPRICTTGLQTWIRGFQDAKKKFFFWFFLLITSCRYIYTSLQRKQIIVKSQICRNQGFSCLLMVGSGSPRPKILRIRNTGTQN